MRVTEGTDDGGGIGMGGLSWNNPQPTYSLHNLQYPDEDDDLYYVDSEPIDMEARLKEVNRALAEDVTPLESSRNIKIRFCEVIASYQSPRDFYVSDSDDGYGDSSDTMYDIEDDIDALTSSQNNKNISSINQHVPSVVKVPNSILVNSSSKKSNSNSNNSENKENIVNGNVETEIKWADPVSTDNSRSSVQSNVPRLDLNFESTHDSNQTQNSINLNTTPEESIFFATTLENNENSSEVNSGILISNLNNINSGDNLFTKCSTQPQADKEQAKDIFRATPVEEAQDYDSDEFHEEDISEEIVTEPLRYNTTSSHTAESTPPEIQAPLTIELPTTKPKQPSLNQNNIDSTIRTIETENDTPTVIQENASSLPSINQPDRNNASSSSDDSGLLGKDNKSSNKRKQKTDVSTKQKVSNNSSERGRSTHRSKTLATTAPTIKPALIKADKLCQLSTHESRGRNTRHGRHARPPTPAGPRTTNSVRSDQSSSVSSSTSSSRQRRHSLSKDNLNNPIQATTHNQSKGSYDRSQRKASPSPVMSSTHTRPSSTRPVKAVHGNSLNKRIQFPTQSLYQRPPSATRSKGSSGSSNLSQRHKGVRKAASTTDLHRTDEQTERQKESEAVYKAWLKQKNQEAARNKKAQAAARTANASNPATNMMDRKALAEQAFQAWLKRKREQLKLEKRMRSHHRRLDHQAHLARTRAECDDAYKEWCQRKREEVAASRAGGVAGRSHSLERSWAREKTRQLYTTYLAT